MTLPHNNIARHMSFHRISDLLRANPSRKYNKTSVHSGMSCDYSHLTSLLCFCISCTDDTSDYFSRSLTDFFSIHPHALDTSTSYRKLSCIYCTLDRSPRRDVGPLLCTFQQGTKQCFHLLRSCSICTSADILFSFFLVETDIAAL